MKRCPTCNRTFDEDWLAFCTQDGTTLVETSPLKSDEPPPTIMAPPPPPPAGIMAPQPPPPAGWTPPPGGPGSGQFQSQPIPPPPPPSNVPSGGFGSGQFGQPMQADWQPPPPPPFAQGTKQGLAIASMICGIFSITIGWCCYLGVLSAPAAIGMGIYQLSQIKKSPDQNSGKPFALVGIITGSLYFVFLAIIVLIYGFAIFMGALNNK